MTERVVFQVGPVTVSLDPAGGDRVCHYEQKEGYERESLAEWAKIACKGIVLDVGAYTGLYSIAAAKLGAIVVAFEPMPIIRERLRENIAFNGVADRIIIVPSAVSDKVGKATITYTPASDFTAGASLSGALSAQPLSQEVRTTTLDAYPIYGSISAIKIDVERHEREVIAGAKDLIRLNRPPMIVECWTKEARQDLARMLPAYAPAREMDGRNILLEPT